jgi:hypothetical protein
MSAGNFIFSRYQSTSLPGDPIMIARIQPETQDLVLGGAANEQAGSTVTLPLRVNISGSNNSLGVKPRTVTLRWITDVPAGYAPNGVLKVPIMTPALWDAIDPGITTGTYLGGTVRVVGKSPERYR